MILLIQAGGLWAATADKLDQVYQQARQLYAGTGVTQDVAKAVALFEEAARAGHPEAQLKLGLLHELGIGYRQDFSQAIKWYHLAALQQQPVAQTRLGILLSKDLSAGKVMLGTNLVVCPDYELSAKWLRAAAEQDYAPAQLLLGDMVKLVFIKGPTKAQWLRREHGDGVGWYARAATNGMPGATWKTANAFLDMGNHAQAYLWLYRAQAEGFTEATGLLEKIEPSMGPGTRFEVKRANAEKWFRPWNPKWREWHELVFLINSGGEALDGAAARKYEADLRAAAEKGNPAAQFNLALNLQHPPVQFSGLVPTSSDAGDYIVPTPVNDLKRRTEAVQWYERAARQNHRDAQYHLAMMLRYGLTGETDFVQARQWFLKASQAGQREAQYELAMLLDEGFTGASQPEEALRWFQRAAQAGHLGAQTALAQRAKITAGAQGVSPAVTNKVARVAIIKLNAEFKDAEDFLMAGLSKQNGVELVERTEIQRILGEQALSMSNQSQYLKLGQLLRADGLMVLERVSLQGKDSLRTSWIAVGPGIVLSQSETALPLVDVSSWSQKLTGQFEALGKKMTLTVRDAVPVSLLNLHSAIATPGSDVLERQLTGILKQRLLRQPEVFVLERSHLGQLVLEKDLTSGAEQSFWNGSYLLEGVLNRSGVQSNRLSIDLQLTSPWHNVKKFTLQGPADQPEQLLTQLAEQVLTELIKGGRNLQWSPEDEAQRFFTEARWAFRRNLLAEAQQAGESARALGVSSPDLAALLIQIYLRDAQFTLYPSNPGREKEPLEKLLKGVELFVQLTNTVSAKLGPATNVPPEWVSLSGELLSTSIATLDRYTRVAIEMDPLLAADLARLRAVCRDSIPSLLKSVDKMDEKLAGDFLRRAVFDNALYHDTPPSAAESFRQLILTGVFRRALNLEPRFSQVRRMNFSTWEKIPDGPKVMYKAYEAVFDELEKDVRPEVREDVLLGRLTLARSVHDFKNYFQALSRFLWEQRESYAKTDRLKNLLDKMRVELAYRDRIQTEDEREILKQVAEEMPLLETKLQPWLALREQRSLDAARQKQADWQREVKEKQAKFFAEAKENARMAETNRYAQLVEILKHSDRSVSDMLVLIPRNMTEEQARELQTLMPAYRARVGSDLSYNFLEMSVAKALKKPVTGLSPQMGVDSPAYLRAIPVRVPDWKSANLPEVDKRFTVPPGMVQAGRFVPPDVRLVQNAKQARQTNYFTVDAFWQPPVRLPDEDKDKRSVIRKVEVWQDNILLEINRDQFGNGGQCWLKFKLGETQVTKIAFPKGLKSQAKVLPALVLCQDALLGAIPEGVLRYSLKEEKWDIIPLNLPAGCQFYGVANQLIAWNRDGIYRIDLASAAIKIMASSHRQPAENLLDGLPEYGVSQVARLGKENMVVVVSGKSYLWNSVNQLWSELKTPAFASPRFVPLGDSLLLSMSANNMDGGYLRFDDDQQAAKPFIQFQDAEVIFPPTYDGREAVMPRWICLKLWSDDSGLQMVPLKEGFLAVSRDYMAGGPQTSAVNKIGTFFLFLPGIDRPVVLLPQVPPEMAGMLQTAPDYHNKDYSLRKTSTHLISISHDRRGLWLVSLDTLRTAAAEPGEKLKRLLDEKIALLPGQPRLQKIKAEQNNP